MPVDAASGCFAPGVGHNRHMSQDQRIGVLFVCLGNICRSPIAEGVFLHKINERRVAARFSVDSAGTGGWHAGEPADSRAQAAARRMGVTLVSRARQVRREDFDRFHYLIAMDQSNIENLLDLGAPSDRTHLLLDFAPGQRMREVPDPYYGGEDGFDTVFRLVDLGCTGLLDELARKHGRDW